MAERTEKTPYYEQVATKLIKQLEAGTAPWQKPGFEVQWNGKPG